MGGTFPTAAGFQDSDFFQQAIKMMLRCILHVINFNPVTHPVIIYAVLMVLIASLKFGSFPQFFFLSKSLETGDEVHPWAETTEEGWKDRVRL